MQCPVCKVDNVQGPTCRRCKADLSLLFRLEAQREGCCGAARKALRERRFCDTIAFAARADGLRHDDEALQIAAVGYLFYGDFEQALRYYRQAARGVANNATPQAAEALIPR